MRRRVRVIVQVLRDDPPINVMESETPIASSRQYMHPDIPTSVPLDDWCDHVAEAVKNAVQRRPSW